MASAEQNNNQDWRSFIEKVSHQGLLKNMPFIIFLAIVSGLYIYSSQLAIDRQKKIDKLNQEIKESYNQHDIGLRKPRLIATLLLGMSFVILFGFLDVIMYPDILGQMIKARIITCIVLSLLLFSLLRNWLSNIKFFGLLAPTTVFILINVLVFLTEGSSSPYYAGLYLTVVALSTLIAWTFYESLYACLIMNILYIATSMLYSYTHNTPYYSPIFVNNVFFLVSVSIFCVVSSYLNSKLRFTEFSLNYNLKATNIKLISTQAQLIQSEKINAMGNLSAGILHEINNPLNYAIAAVRIVKMDDKVNEDADLKDTVADIEEGMMRIKNIVSDLHNFAHPEEADKQRHFPVADVIESAIRFTANECRDIEKIIDVPKDLEVSASKTHIVQILINLITNACKAIAKAGNTNGIIKIWTEQKNNRIIISVSDNGIGMNEETLVKVFDPFFTTSEVGKGMGMGLSVSYTIAKNHGGTLFATSKLGEGSVFSFDLSGC